MAFFKNKEDMFNHRADRFKREGQEAERKGNTTKSDWCNQQEKENRQKAKRYKGQEGW